MKKSLLIFICAVAITTAYSQTILNGDFETGTSYCETNSPKTQFDTIISDCKEIGKANQIDIFGGACTTYGSAESGSYFLAMVSDYYNNAEDAISMKLSKAMMIGHTYTLTYYDKYESPSLACSLEFGYSLNDSTFGTLAYSSPYFATTSWGKHTVSIKPTKAATYLTVRTNTQGGGWTFVDNFVLTDLTGIEEATLINITAEVFPNPVTDRATIHFSSDKNLENVQLIVFDALGNKVQQLKPISANTFEITKENSAVGIYFYQIVNENTPVYRGKLVME